MTEDQKRYFVDTVYENINIILKICNIYASESNREDLKQEIIFQLWKSFPSFKGRSKFQTWMYRVALNTAMLSLRKKTPDITEINGELHTVDNYSDKNDPYRKQDDLQEKVKELYRHIATFNDLDKAVTFLYIERCTYKEIAEITGISEKNVSVKLVRIKDRLRKMFNTEKKEYHGE